MKQTGQFLIYGATGFTGKLAARTAGKEASSLCSQAAMKRN